jgi:hypothetical protein
MGEVAVVQTLFNVGHQQLQTDSVSALVMAGRRTALVGMGSNILR